MVIGFCGLGVLLTAVPFAATARAEIPSSSPDDLEAEITRARQDLQQKKRAYRELRAQIAALENRIKELKRRRPEAKAIAQIESVGGNFKVDKGRSGEPVVEVSFFDSGSSPRFKDSQVSRLCDLKELTVLEFDNNGISDATIANISVLPKLSSLGMWENGITDKSLPHIGKIITLRALALNESQLSDKGVSHLVNLKRLESLSLYGTRITDSSVPHISKLKKLKKLVITKTKITQRGVTQLRANLPDCNIVWRATSK